MNDAIESIIRLVDPSHPGFRLPGNPIFTRELVIERSTGVDALNRLFHEYGTVPSGNLLDAGFSTRQAIEDAFKTKN